MSEVKQVSCIKCRNFWIAIGCLAVVTLITIGYGFLGFTFEIIINEVDFMYGLIYGLAVIGTGFSIFVSLVLFKRYCRKEEPNRDGMDLCCGSVGAFFAIILIAMMAYYVPILQFEYQISALESDEAKIIAIKNLSCKYFLANIESNTNMFYSKEHREYEYVIYIWDQEELDAKPFGIKYSMIESANPKYYPENEKGRWLYEKYLECKQ